ncbi:MAG: DUF4992 family lipoprotein [Prevotella sp.]
MNRKTWIELAKGTMHNKWFAACSIGIAGLMAASCAQDGFDEDERFVSDVTNAVMTSPSSDDITITASADGKTRTASWPLVKGAGGYLVTVINKDIPEEPIVKDSIVDGCSVTFKSEEDVNYLLTIKTLGNAKNNNKDAENTTELNFSTFTPTYAVIPANSDLKTYFDSNPLPADKLDEELNFDLEAGATYTMSGAVDFGAFQVTLRTNSKNNNAKIRMTGEDAGFILSNGFTLKYLNIDYTDSNAGLLVMSTTPAIEPHEGSSNYYVVTPPIRVMGCNIENLRSYIFYDSSVKTWLPTTLIIDNTVIHLATTVTAIKDQGYIWTNKGNGFIKDLTISNSTVYNTGEVDVKYFVQYGGMGISNTDFWDKCSVNYTNCTFYEVCKAGQWGNYNGIQGKKTSYWVMTNCIFYNCSASGVARRFLHGRPNQETATFENNTYMKADGTFDTPAPYDNSGTQIEEDPCFADPANGNFTISGPTQVARKTGDPRWLP